MPVLRLIYPHRDSGIYVLSYAFAPTREIIRKWSGVADLKTKNRRVNLAVEANEHAAEELETRLRGSSFFDRSEANINMHVITEGRASSDVPAPPDDKWARKLFYKFDEDGNGHLERDELDKVLGMGTVLFSSIDGNTDGKITLQEWN